MLDAITYLCLADNNLRQQERPLIIVAAAPSLYVAHTFDYFFQTAFTHFYWHWLESGNENACGLELIFRALFVFCTWRSMLIKIQAVA